MTYELKLYKDTHEWMNDTQSENMNFDLQINQYRSNGQWTENA